MSDLQHQLHSIVGERLKVNEPMAKRTNFRIGGPADFFLDVQSRDEAVAVFQTLAASETPFFVLGGGSNTLVADQGYRGTVVQLALRKHEIRGTMVLAEAGVLSAFLARATVDAGLTGFEWAIGLPGTIGGAVRGNAGCYGGETKDAIHSVEVLLIKDMGTGSVGIEREEWSKEQCAFGYRDSAFKHLIPGPIVLAATFSLAPGDREAGRKRLQEILGERKEHQPLANSSAGCIFKNFEFKDEKELSLLQKHLEIPARFLESGRVPVGWLIEQAGLKGFAVGAAQVSDKHGNFCVNTGHATASEVRELVRQVKERVRDLYGLDLHEEVQYLGF